MKDSSLVMGGCERAKKKGNKGCIGSGKNELKVAISLHFQAPEGRKIKLKASLNQIAGQRAVRTDLLTTPRITMFLPVFSSPSLCLFFQACRETKLIYTALRMIPET